MKLSSKQIEYIQSARDKAEKDRDKYYILLGQEMKRDTLIRGCRSAKMALEYKVVCDSLICVIKRRNS